MQTYSFTGYATADLFSDGHIASHAVFTQPDAPTLAYSVSDNDSRLSGDAYRNEKGDDTSGQHAEITRDGEEVGNGGRLYAERAWYVHGDDGETYVLVELEQPGHLPDTFTFFGNVPPSGTQLTVGHAVNVFGKGLSYDDLGAGELPSEPLPNIVEIAAGSPDFEVLVLALGAANLVETVQNATDITVFAPTDAAFAQLATDLGFDGDTDSAQAVFDFIAGALSGLAEDGDPIPLLTNILLYHVSPGEKSAEDIAALTAVPTLLEGATFGSEGTELVDNEPDVANPNIAVPDVAASNGTIQVIDRVLLPIDIPGNEPADPTLTGIVAASGGVFDNDGSDFDLLFNALQVAGLDAALDDPDAEFTVFAPNDDAFVDLAQLLGFKGSDEGTAFGYIVDALTLLGKGDPLPLLTEILTYHVAPGALDATAVLGATEIPTLQGGTLGVDGTNLVDADPDIADPGIIATDIPASNGIAHVIDGVLLPIDLEFGEADDLVIKNDKSNKVFTGKGNDLVDANGGKDKIWLGSGDDVGFGGAGHDLILGGSGKDLIVGGTGNDILVGGKDEDVFVFNSGDGIDRILRFEDGVDTIDLSSMGYAGYEAIEDSITYTKKGARIELADDQVIVVHAKGVELDMDDFLL